MTTKHRIALYVIAFAFMISGLGFTSVAQHSGHQHGTTTQKSGGMADTMGMKGIMSMMGKATFEQAVDGFNIQVWLITQEEHKAMMSKHQEMMQRMKHDEKTHEAMMSGTHHIMVVLTNERTKKPVKDSEVKIHTISPSEKSEMQTLIAMVDHYGGGLNLTEKGKYTVMVHAKAGNKTPAASFEYEVK